MAEYTYDPTLINQAQGELDIAIKKLALTDDKMQKGINMLRTYCTDYFEMEKMESTFNTIMDYSTTIITDIKAQKEKIKEKVEEIEKFDNASSTNAPSNASTATRVFATVSLAGVKVLEGIVTGLEKLGDGLLSFVGFVGGLFSSDFQNCIADFIKKDLTDDQFTKWYEADSGPLSWLNRNSYWSHDAAGFEYIKGFGSVLPYVALGLITGGGTAALAGFTFLGAVGNGTQSGLQEHGDFNKAFGQGIKQGVIAGGTTLIVGGLANKLGGGKVFSKTKRQNMFTNAKNNLSYKFGKTRPGRFTYSVKPRVGKVLAKGKNALNTKFGNNRVYKFISTGKSKAGNIIAKGATKIDNGIKNFGINTRTGRAISKTITNHPIATSSLVAFAGQKAGENFNQNITPSTNYENGVYDNSTPTQQQELAQQQQAPLPEKPELKYDTPTQYNNTQLKTPVPPTKQISSQPVPQVNVPKPQEYTASKVGPATPNTKAPTTPNVKVPTTPNVPNSGNGHNSGGNYNPITGGGLPGGSGGYGNGKPNVNPGGVSAGTNYKDLTGSTNNPNLQSDNLMDTLGDTTGSFSDMISNSVDIPSSSTPILAPEETTQKSSSIIPLAAGLGAASLAGVGTKAFLDKREKSEEDDDESISTEEWEEDKNSMEIECLEEENAEADYLTPADEYAFQEG